MIDTQFVRNLGKYVPSKSSTELIEDIKMNTKETLLFGAQVVFDPGAWGMVLAKKFHEKLTAE